MMHGIALGSFTPKYLGRFGRELKTARSDFGLEGQGGFSSIVLVRHFN
jgi:hypothetical protein